MNTQEIDQRITLAALEPYIEHMGRTAVFMAVVPVTVVAVLWDQVNQGILVIWLLLMLTSIGIRYRFSTAYGKRQATFREAGIWCRRMQAISLVLGLLWSFAILTFFVESSPPHQVFIITVAVTLGIGSISAGTHWLPLYYVYGVPILLAITVRLLMVATLPYIALAAMMFLALLASLAFVKKLNSIVRSEMELRHQSAELASQLRIKTEEAEEAVYAKSRVLAAASHDLRQPLHALSLFFDALKEPQSANEQVRIFKRIDTSIGSLRKLFDTLFDMSRLDANVVHPEYSHFDIRQCLEDLYEEYRGEARERQLTLKLQVTSCVVKSDRALLERILRNLISNALHYTHSGTVLIAARKRQGSVLVQVWDTGIGIPRESQENVFQEFQRLHDSSTRSEKGLGFGLAIVRRLCELMNHPLSLRSIIGRGSMFSVEVPKGNAGLAMEQPTNQYPPEHNPGYQVMVIDDDPSILNAMNTLLSAWGFNVVVAASLDEALAQANRCPSAPDLILSDLSLQGNDSGIEVIHRLRAHFDSEVPGILISGSTNAVQLKQAETSGLRLIQKPISPIMLRSIIQHHLAAAEAG